MRWLFLFVLSLNVAYIAWEMSKTPSVDYADVPMLKNVETIVLLSELKRQQAELTESGSVAEGVNSNTGNAAKDSQSDSGQAGTAESEKTLETGPDVI
jgi:hypothetical protein